LKAFKVKILEYNYLNLLKRLELLILIPRIETKTGQFSVK